MTHHLLYWHTSSTPQLGDTGDARHNPTAFSVHAGCRGKNARLTFSSGGPALQGSGDSVGTCALRLCSSSLNACPTSVSSAGSLSFLQILEGPFLPHCLGDHSQSCGVKDHVYTVTPNAHPDPSHFPGLLQPSASLRVALEPDLP